MREKNQLKNRNVTPMWFKDYDCDTNVTAILHLPKTP